MKKKQFLLLFAFLTILSCERDDICAEGTATTPRLLVEFYDINNPDDLKSVSRLTVYGEGLPDPNPPVANVDETILFNENTTAVELPLIVGIDDDSPITARFILEKDTNLRLDEDDTTQSDIDIIEITYTTEFVYVSRACGYKSIFNNLDIDLEDDSWISAVETIVTEVENENTVHVRILH